MGHVGRLDWGWGGEGKRRDCATPPRTSGERISFCCLLPQLAANKRALSAIGGEVTQTGPLHIHAERVCVHSVAFVVLNFDDKVREETAPAGHD